MAELKIYALKLWNLEGGYVNNPNDKGGSTNRGITFETLRLYNHFNGFGEPTLNNLKNINFTLFCSILKWHSWDYWKADKIVNQSVAELVVDWHFNSGKWGITIPQRILGLESDGIVGKRTISAINGIGELVFNQLKDARKKFFEDIVLNHPNQKVFLKGWINRINKFKYEKTT